MTTKPWHGLENPRRNKPLIENPSEAAKAAGIEWNPNLESAMTDIKHTIVTWTEGDEVEVAEDLNNALKTVFDGHNCPAVIHVDSGGSWHSIVIASRLISNEEAQALYEADAGINND